MNLVVSDRKEKVLFMKKLKILVTGKNRRIATDICNHLAEDRDYSVIKCAAKQDDIFRTVPNEMPKVIIICLGDEKKETIRVYDILKECAKLGALTIIVVANQEDKSGQDVFLIKAGIPLCSVRQIGGG